MMKNQLAGLMQQAQKMQENMKRLQDELAQLEVEGQSGAGMVKVVMTCKNQVRRVSIDPGLVGEDRDMLEDLVAAAFNDAVRRAEELAQQKMSSVTAGMPMPPGCKLPFGGRSRCTHRRRAADARAPRSDAIGARGLGRPGAPRDDNCDERRALRAGLASARAT